MLSFLFPSSPAPSPRLALIEHKLDLILAKLGIEMPEDEFAEVRMLAASKQKISAIALYRRMTGVGLAEAKAFVDGLG